MDDTYMGITLHDFSFLILNVSEGQNMQEEHPVHLKQNKMLVSAMLLHFGVFHNSSCLITLASPAALGYHRALPPAKVKGCSFWDQGALMGPHRTHNRALASTTHFIKQQQETHKRS